MEGKPSLATAGSRATLHSIFLTPKKNLLPNPALAQLEENQKSGQKEDETGEAIMIASPHEDEEDAAVKNSEDSKAGAKATSTETSAANERKSERNRRKAERALRRARKARRQLRLDPDA